MPTNRNHSIFRPVRTHGIGAGSDDDFVYKGYRVSLQRYANPPTYWIEKDGHVVYRSAKSPHDAKSTIDNDLAG
jgi:hypothetical protein